MTSASTQSLYNPALDSIFRARSVALMGASANPRSPGATAQRILKATGFAGKVYPINPKYPEIEGLKCYPSIEALPEVPDVALMIIPGESVPQAVETCGKRGVRAAVVLSTGFEESQGGKNLAQELSEAARKYGVAVVGPNCQGIWSVKSNVMLTFGGAAQTVQKMKHAPIAVISQSGAFSGSIGNYLQEHGIGCSYVISSGNETVVGALDYLSWLIEQDDVKLVLLHLEGLKDGADILRIAERARARGVDLAVLKTGNSIAGQKAAASHTGKIATAYSIYRDIFDQAGIIQVRTLTELFEISDVLTTLKPPRKGAGNSGVMVASNSGGACSLLADLMEEHKVPLATLQAETLGKLKEIFPPYGNANNPADIATDNSEVYQKTVDLLTGDPAAEAIIFQLSSGGQRIVRTNGEIMKATARKFTGPSIVSFSGQQFEPDDRRAFHDARILGARDPGEAVRYLGWLYQRREIAARPATAPASAAPRRAAPSAAWESMVDFLGAAGIPVPAWKIVGPADAAASLQQLHLPVAVKALPSDSDHKTEAGLVMLNIPTASDAIAAAMLIRERMKKPDAGILVQEMAPSGVEVVLSVMRTPEFGPILAIGSGGVAVEIYGDIGYLALPVEERHVRRLLQRLKLWVRLQGFRGQPKADVDALIAAAIRLSQIAAACPEISEVEINPLFVLPEGKGVIGVDALIKKGPGPH